MNDLEELKRFRAEVGPASAEAWASARSALARAVLAESRDHTIDQAEGTATALPLGLPGDLRRAPHGLRSLLRRPRVLATVAAATGAAAVVAGATVLAQTSDRSPSVPRTEASRALSHVPRSGSILRLADYKFRLPPGFRAVDSTCATRSRPRPDAPITVLQYFAVAGAADGACIHAELAAGQATVPTGARPIQIGAYQGFISSDTPTRETLFVAIPTTGGNHYLVVTGIGVTPAQLRTVVTSGLPNSAGPARPCTANCA